MQAAPAYTAVAARHTLQRPNTSATLVKPQKVTWSPDVRLYVQRAFEPDNAMQGIDLPAMQEKLKVVITNAAESGQLETIDWSQYPLPQHLIQADRDQAAMYSAQHSLTNFNVPIMSSPAGGAYSLGSSSKKRKNGDFHMNDAEIRDTTPPGKRKNTKGALEDRLTGKTTGQTKKEKKAEAFRARDLGANADVLEKRRQRFGVVTSPEPSTFVLSHSPSPTSGPLVGTCQKLEKSYFRLTAPPLPETVRPLAVLERALHHIRTKWKQDHNYSYTCDQLKSLRQDLTVQHIKTELTVKTYEVHARIALEMKDLGEYNQCQTQLRALYKLKLGGKQEEFTAYRILYIIFTCNRSDMNNVLADLTPADKQMPAVQNALKVRAALASGNYHKFFRLYREAPFLGPYLLDMIIERERLAAMAAICKTYKPDVSLHFLAQELAFNSDDSDESDPDAGPRHCLDFLCEHDGEPFIERKGDGDVRFATGKAIAVFERARALAFRGIDAKPRK